MKNPSQCQTCGEPTEIIGRRIGFFGLAETYCTHCRKCLSDAATAAGMDPDQVLAEYDERVAAVAAGKRRYAASRTLDNDRAPDNHRPN